MSLRVYQGGKKPVVPADITARIVNERDEPVFTETTPLAVERFAANRSTDYSLDLPLARLAAGQYLLTVEMTQRNVHLRRDIRFTVQ